jgi:hypothetical protein
MQGAAQGAYRLYHALSNRNPRCARTRRGFLYLPVIFSRPKHRRPIHDRESGLTLMPEEHWKAVFKAFQSNAELPLTRDYFDSRYFPS